MSNKEPKKATLGRFDFCGSTALQTDSECQPGQKASIKEVKEEIFYEYDENISFGSLQTSLRLLRIISGQKLASETEALPLTTLKSIKLLHKHAKASNANLIKLIEIPEKGTGHLLDFLTSPEAHDSSENKSIVTALNAMRTALALEIDADEREQIDDICDPTKLREAYWKDTNNAIDHIILRHIRVDEDLIVAADTFLTEQTQKYSESIMSAPKEERVHVALYMFLNSLFYTHVQRFYIDNNANIPGDPDIENKAIDFSDLCDLVSREKDLSVTPVSNFLDPQCVRNFSEHYANWIAPLVQEVTGHPYTAEQLKLDKEAAHIILEMTVKSEGLPNEKNRTPVNILLIVAAFASIRRQREEGTSLWPKKSKRFSPKIADYQRQLNLFIIDKTKKISWAAKTTFTQRLRWYALALAGMKDRADSHNRFQVAQSELALRLFSSFNHRIVYQHMQSYRQFMVQSAKDFIVAHDRQDTVYEWNVLR